MVWVVSPSLVMVEMVMVEMVTEGRAAGVVVCLLHGVFSFAKCEKMTGGTSTQK